MKKEIISLGKVNLSNKIITANSFIKKQDNNFIINNMEMDILEGKYNEYDEYR